MLFTTLVAALCGLTVIVTASPLHKRDYPSPESCTGNCSWIHDPSIVKKGNTYYRFSTSGNIAIATATSLTGPWKYKGALLENGPSIHVADGQDVWAPDVTKVGDTYYCFYAVSRMGLQSSDIGFATSKSLDPGTWTDYGSLGLPKSRDYNLIDPNLLLENDGTLHLVFGSYWNDIHQVTLSAPPKSFSAAAQLPQNIIRNTTLSPAVAEGAYQFKHGEFYYVFFSVGQCCNTPPNLPKPGDEYKIMVCRATAVTGPFFDQAGRSCLTGNGGTLVLASHGDVYSPGGQGIMLDGGRVVMYYHYVKPSVGYKADQFFFGFNYLDFGSNGWPVVQ